eukprot:5965634-Prymnesium_polylepis.1
MAASSVKTTAVAVRSCTFVIDNQNSHACADATSTTPQDNINIDAKPSVTDAAVPLQLSVKQSVDAKVMARTHAVSRSHTRSERLPCTCPSLLAPHATAPVCYTRSFGDAAVRPFNPPTCVRRPAQ